MIDIQNTQGTSKGPAKPLLMRFDLNMDRDLLQKTSLSLLYIFSKLRQSVSDSHALFLWCHVRYWSPFSDWKKKYLQVFYSHGSIGLIVWENILIKHGICFQTRIDLSEPKPRSIRCSPPFQQSFSGPKLGDWTYREAWSVHQTWHLRPLTKASTDSMHIGTHVTWIRVQS